MLHIETETAQTDMVQGVTANPPGAMQIYVCVTCRTEGELPEPKEQRSGARLFAALSTQAQGAFEIVPVECLSVCKKPCTVSFAAPGKWTYVYGDLLPGVSEDIILAGARLYDAAPDGIITWKLRPDALKKGVVARIPPLPLGASAAASANESISA